MSQDSESQDINTLELAKVYENQGYYKDAHKIYSYLNDQETTYELRSGIERLEEKMKEEPGVSSKKDISQLMEEWLKLMVSKHRVDNLKKIKDQIS